MFDTNNEKKHGNTLASKSSLSSISMVVVSCKIELHHYDSISCVCGVAVVVAVMVAVVVAVGTTAVPSALFFRSFASLH